jgi:predicted AlkP superfamily pyrophosphatase or phosphodiesterase
MALAAPPVDHCLVMGVDGLSVDGVRKATVPHLRGLMARGAWTLRARAVMPSSSSPNWASMIMGAPPDQHGITSNDWQPYKYEKAPSAVGAGGIFPTLFGVLREQRPDSIIAVFHDWKDFGRLLETNAPNVLKHVKDALETVAEAADCFETKKPHLLFIHIDGVDHAGHAFGWTSEQYYKEVEMVDALIGAVVETVQRAGLTDRTAILVTSDHGGKGKKHGGASKEELEIPWILSGPGIAQGRQLQGNVEIYDTAPTLAHLLGLTPPKCWVGKPVLEALQAPDLRSTATSANR